MTDSIDLARAWSAVAEARDANTDYIDEHAVEATTTLLDRVAVQPGERVLELAAGPGILGATWSALVGPAGAVVVSDIAPGCSMSPAVETRSSAMSRPRVIDLAAIDQPDGSSDVVACRMGLMFTPGPSAAFAEIFRVLRPGGRLGALTWALIEQNPWMTCVGMAAMANSLASGVPPFGPGGTSRSGGSSGTPNAREGCRVRRCGGRVPSDVSGRHHRRPC